MNDNGVYMDSKIRSLRELYADLLTDDLYALPVKKQLELQADRLAQAHRAGNDAVCFQIGSWHPALVGKPDTEIMAHAFGVDDARVTIAREYGFADWKDAASIGERHSNVRFEQAVNTMLAGDLASLRVSIREIPGFVSARSQYGHRATLLHYAGTNGVESYRQIVPLNLAEIVGFLIAAGADPIATAHIYGASTPRHLFDTSKHSYESGVHPRVVAVFDKHGAAGSH
jgi:hypothetical protein